MMARHMKSLPGAKVIFRSVLPALPPLHVLLDRAVRRRRLLGVCNRNNV